MLFSPAGRPGDGPPRDGRGVARVERAEARQPLACRMPRVALEKKPDVRVGIFGELGDPGAQPAPPRAEGPGRLVPGLSAMPSRQQVDDAAFPRRRRPLAPRPIFGEVAGEEQVALVAEGVEVPVDVAERVPKALEKEAEKPARWTAFRPRYAGSRQTALVERTRNGRPSWLAAYVDRSPIPQSRPSAASWYRSTSCARLTASSKAERSVSKKLE